MQLLYAPGITLPLYTLAEDESKHAVRVLRMSTGDAIYLTDGLGNMYTARITDANPRKCVVEILGMEAEVGKRDYSLTMAVAPTKSADRYGWFLEKATEIGIDNIIPLDCRHSERHSINHARENKVITSAMKQSVKAYHPSLEQMRPFKETVSAFAQFEGKKLIAHCHEAIKSKKHIAQVVNKGDAVTILIGPEGDFSTEEIKAAVEAGFVEISLGNTRLRTETAALGAVMYVSFINQQESTGK